ncbi:MAG: DNA polymerase III subunit epsilon [Alphaproteobacteria bacterium]|mgnify:CR=1 FL=1|nr:DNA polymerase III subunit epsilon [Alphaproteobacteria bacterium]
MKEIVLDTETTGMDPNDGHRIIEIGCVELDNHIPTGRHLQLYINPERDIPADATAVHGITNEFVADKPVFSQVYSEFMDFIGEASLVIHNAEFDMKFINWELKQVGHAAVPWSRIVDTLGMARKKFPGSPANLDALCRRFGIDNTQRTYHGALLDSELLAEVYLELLGGRQHGLGLAAERVQSSANEAQAATRVERVFREPRSYEPSAEEQAAHEALLEKLKDPLWTKSA